ncbi:MAG: hypothetical protein WD029_06665, partial [Microthrixaceae bacterium]
MMKAADSTDPFRERVYALEAQALEDNGRKFAKFAQIESYVESVLLSPWWEHQFPAAPLDVQLFRRSRSATFSAAAVDRSGEEAAIWIRDGSWDAVTVVHELAHVASAQPVHSPDPTGAHGQAFTTALLVL